MTVTVASIQGWSAEVQSAIASLPEALDQAAPSGGFAEVLSRVAGTISAGPGGAVAGTTATATTATATTASATLEAFDAGPAPTSGPRAQEVLGLARSLVGTPYVWGGDSPQQGFDCSGLVQYVYGAAGIDLPRTSEEQARVGSAVPGLAQAQPGDLVFFAGSDGTPTSPGHVGIYLGAGQMIDAPYSGTDVQVQPVSAAGTPVAIRSVLPTVLPSPDGASPSYPAPAVASSSSTSVGTGVPPRLAPLFLSAAGRYGVPVTLLTAVARHESEFEPDVVSSAGAEGIMQIMPGTAAGLGVTPFTPGQAINGAAKLLSGYIGQFGSVPLALAAYDAGAGAVQKYGGIPPYPETQAYVTSIMHALGSSAAGGVQ